MKQIFILLTVVLCLAGCTPDTYINSNDDNGGTASGGNNGGSAIDDTDLGGESLIICCEGLWQSDNGQLSFYNGKTGTLTNQWFRTINNQKLGDTPNDIIQVNDTLIAIAVNWSNIIQFIRPDGTACGATEDIPNNRRLCSDGKYLYVTSYAHQCGAQTFTKGYVAKIDITTKKVVGTCEVGWEPEGIQYYKGKLYVANTGGYAYSEGHDYESTIMQIDAANMAVDKVFDTGHPNLYSKMSQIGQYLLVNSTGNYADISGCTVVFDCESGTTTTFDKPATYNATDGKYFYTVGTNYSYTTDGYSAVTLNRIDPVTMTATDVALPEAVVTQLNQLKTPYEIYISPYTGNIYFTDASEYTSGGALYGFTKEGKPLFSKLKVYMNPGHILALPKSSN